MIHEGIRHYVFCFPTYTVTNGSTSYFCGAEYSDAIERIKGLGNDFAIYKQYRTKGRKLLNTRAAALRVWWHWR